MAGKDQTRGLRRMDAADERQFMINEGYEIYGKEGPPTGALSFHSHNFYEVIYVLEGEYSALVEDRTYHMKKGDFLLVDCNVIHKYHDADEKHEDSKRILLWITRQMLEELSGGEMDLSACFARNAYHFPAFYEEMLKGFLLKLARSDIAGLELPGARAVLDKGYLTLFFVYLNALCGRKEYLFTEENAAGHSMVEKVSAYVEEHISEPISVENLAEQVPMSKYHFLRKFKKLTGMTVHTFVVNKRLLKACEALKEGEKSVTEIYQEAGFADYSSFLRSFRKVFGVAPSKYRDFF